MMDTNRAPSAVAVVGWTVLTFTDNPLYRSFLNSGDAMSAALEGVYGGAYGAMVRRFWADGLVEACYVAPLCGEHSFRAHVTRWDVASDNPFWRTNDR